jgi:flagellar hook assembly protein FlgD
MTGVINAAHASGARVVLTVQSFAWTSTGVAQQRALLGRASARANLARQIAAAVRNRGADGVNLDFEPIISTYADEFTALVRSIRTELNRYSRGYQLTFDATGWIGNYPISAATASGAADAVVIMAYDYRTGTSRVAGSVAAIGGASYDIRDTIASYVSRVPASKIILGVPYYGRAWSTTSSNLHGANISSTKYGASTTVNYTVARDYAAQHGRKWDGVEGSAWTSYRRESCTNAYGCVNPWRQLYYDDTVALGLKYDLVNRYGLRGAGIWALGYDGTRPELYQVLKDKFITDKVPPVISGSSLSVGVISPNGDRILDATTMRVAVTGQQRFFWTVQRLVNGSAQPVLRSGSAVSRTVAFQWDGKSRTGWVVPDGLYWIRVYVADASNNYATISRTVVVDHHAAIVTTGATPTTISPNGDGRGDRTTLTMHADSAITGSVRLIDKNGTGVRRWTFAGANAGYWTWNGKDTAGRTVPDGRYTLRVWGYDRGGSGSIKNSTVRVDRTLRSVTWSRASFIAASKQSARVSFVVTRPARVTIAIHSASGVVVRGIWLNRALAAGSYGWTWNGRTSAGVLLKPGTYRAIVTTSTWIGVTTLSRTVVVR